MGCVATKAHRERRIAMRWLCDIHARDDVVGAIVIDETDRVEHLRNEVIGDSRSMELYRVAVKRSFRSAYN